MKKIIALLLVLIFVFAFGACGDSINETSVEESALVSNDDLKTTDESIANDKSYVIDESFEDTEEPDYFLSTVSHGNLIYVTEDEDFNRELWIKYENGEKFKIHEGHFITSAEASPDGKHLLFTEYEWETVGKLYVFDVEARTSKEIVYENKKDLVVYNAEWIDDESIVFTDIYSQGTVALGGKVLKYNIDRQFMHVDVVFVTPPDNRLQISDVTKKGDDFILTAHYYDEGFAESETLYYSVPYSAIKKSINDLIMPSDGVKDINDAKDYRHFAVAPTDEERVDLDYIASVAGGREFDYDTLISMTPEQIESEIFAPANRVYREFDGLGYEIIGHYYGSLTLYWDENGKTMKEYFDVVGLTENITCYDDFVSEVRKHFSKEMSKQLFATGQFFEYNGIFMYIDGCRGTHIHYFDHEYSIESYNKDEIVYKCRVAYLKNEYENLKQEEVTEEHCYFEEFTCKLILEDGKWVFDSFKLPY